jgi:glycosyltransferase involved in cell wall biosynthesis/membrane-associated phospholipid phosphatase
VSGGADIRGRPRPSLLDAAEATPFVSAVARRSPWRREVGLFAACYVIYSLARGVSRGSDLDALDNAARVVTLQAQFGLNIERQVQEWISAFPVMALLGTLYLFAQLGAVPLALVVVYRLRRSAYPLLRTTLLAAWMIAIPIYALFPTAPPRLAGIGIVDTVTRESIVPLDAPLVEFFYNPVAAVPSMHAAFAVAVGVGLAVAVRSWILRVGALLWGPLVILVVVATGNHFVLDVVAGLLVVAVAFMVAVALHGAPWRRATAPRSTLPGAWTPLGGADAEPMRIAIVCPYAWDAHGGVAAQVRQMADSMRALGHHVDVLAPADREIDEPGVLRIGGTIGVRHNGSVGRVALSPRANGRALRMVESGGYDVVHLHEPLVPPCLTILLRSTRPLLGTFHMYGPDSLLYRALAPAGRVAARRLHHRTAVSEAARACATKFLGGDYEVIANGVAPHAPVPAPWRTDEGFRILFIGRNDPRKGLATLLRAAARTPSALLDVVGVERAEVAALYAEVHPGMSLPASVRVHGRVSDDRRRELLAETDVLCAPSLAGESFGLVLVEAMAAGVPVVASSIPGYLDVLAPGSGVTVPAGDADALAATLAELAENPLLRRRLAEGGRRWAGQFDWDRLTPRVLRAYTRAIAVHEADARLQPEAPALQPAEVGETGS